MGDLVVTYSLAHDDQIIRFKHCNELEPDVYGIVLNSFMSFETFLYKTAAIQLLNHELNLDATKLIEVVCHNKNESPP